MKNLFKLCLTLVIIPMVIGDAFYAQNNFYYERGQKVFLGISDKFIAVKIKEGVNQSLIDSLSSIELNLDTLKAIIDQENIYKYKVKDPSDMNGLMDRLRKNEAVEYVNPVYVKDGYDISNTTAI